MTRKDLLERWDWWWVGVTVNLQSSLTGIEMRLCNGFTALEKGLRSMRAASVARLDAEKPKPDPLTVALAEMQAWHRTLDRREVMVTEACRKYDEARDVVARLERELEAGKATEGIRAASARISGVPAGKTMIDRVSDEDWLGDEMLNANICAGESK